MLHPGNLIAGREKKKNKRIVQEAVCTMDCLE